MRPIIVTTANRRGQRSNVASVIIVAICSFSAALYWGIPVIVELITGTPNDWVTGQVTSTFLLAFFACCPFMQSMSHPYGLSEYEASVRTKIYFCAPPGWPSVPFGWAPESQWVTPPEWPLAPAGWSFWRNERGEPCPHPKQVLLARVLRKQMTVLGVSVLLFGALIAGLGARELIHSPWAFVMTACAAIAGSYFIYRGWRPLPTPDIRPTETVTAPPTQPVFAPGDSQPSIEPMDGSTPHDHAKPVGSPWYNITVHVTDDMQVTFLSEEQINQEIQREKGMRTRRWLSFPVAFALAGVFAVATIRSADVWINWIVAICVLLGVLAGYMFVLVRAARSSHHERAWAIARLLGVIRGNQRMRLARPSDPTATAPEPPLTAAAPSNAPGWRP